MKKPAAVVFLRQHIKMYGDAACVLSPDGQAETGIECF
jgi:hypothetical protein